MKVSEFYDAVGGNYDDAFARLQSEDFILKLLQMFKRDKSMERLDNAMLNSDAESAFAAVHTLKGIAFNLSITPLAAACGELTEALRNRTELPPDTEKLYNAVKAEYTRVADATEDINK